MVGPTAGETARLSQSQGGCVHLWYRSGHRQKTTSGIIMSPISKTNGVPLGAPFLSYHLMGKWLPSCQDVKLFLLCSEM